MRNKNIQMAEQYWKIFTNINEWIRFSDAKAGIILSVNTVLLTIIFTNINDLKSIIVKSIFLIILSIIILILFAVSILFAFRCLNPKLKSIDSNSIIYFGDISKKYKRYKDYFIYSKDVINNDSYNNQLCEQIYINSKIASNKFINITWSIRTFWMIALNMLVMFVKIMLS